jgi:hypothetical protein
LTQRFWSVHASSAAALPLEAVGGDLLGLVAGWSEGGKDVDPEALVPASLTERETRAGRGAETEKSLSGPQKAGCQVCWYTIYLNYA